MSYDFKTDKLDLSQCNLSPVKIPGCKYKDTLKINLDVIYVPPYTDNPSRKKGKNPQHIDKLCISFLKGINYNKRLPVVRKCNRIIDGKHYDYELVDGNHRFEALERLGFTEWLFDLYEMGLNKIPYSDAKATLQLFLNDHEPQLESSSEDVSNMIQRLVEENSTMVKNDEKSISQYVDTYCSNMHPQTKGKIIRSVVLACGSYQDVVTYTPHDLAKWINEFTNFRISGEFDSKRKQHGWSVKEGYEYEYVMNAARKYYETGNESYFICHTKPPTEIENLNDKRQKMVNKFSELEEALLDVYAYYDKTGEFPWSVVGFMPQDKKNKEIMTKLVVI